MQPIDAYYRIATLFIIFLAALYLERLRPLRKATQPKFKRIFTNLFVAGTSAVILRIIFYPIVLYVAQITEQNSWGLSFYLDLQPIWALVLSLLVLDYTLYFWHVLLHKTKFLWRFHNVHHIDLDLDTSTALRFHFGELIASVVFRTAQILVFGIGPFTLILFETCITSFAQIHHSNIKLPPLFETWLTKVVVGPRMHGIHHSVIRQERDSNFGTIFTFWDRIHKTLRLNIPQDEITIGVPSYLDPIEQSPVRLLILPFKRQRDPHP